MLPMPTEPLDELRTIIDSLPETAEKLSHGSPTWWGGKKTFATYHAGAYDQGRRAVWIKAPDGAAEALISADPQRFYRPKYLGPSGWVGVRLEGRVNWAEIRALLVQGYRLVAPKRALAILDAGS
jgi:predicted DNA-binding protein (MmcQ/YjbR family)